MEIRDAMAYFRLAVSPDDDLAFERVVNTPKRGLGDVAVQKIQRMVMRSFINGKGFMPPFFKKTMRHEVDDLAIADYDTLPAALGLDILTATRRAR